MGLPSSEIQESSHAVQGALAADLAKFPMADSTVLFGSVLVISSSEAPLKRTVRVNTGLLPYLCDKRDKVFWKRLKSVSIKLL